MKVVIRTDASILVGSGHVMRCLVLADELKKRKYSVSFACLPQKGDLVSYIEERGFEVFRLTPPPVPVQPKYNDDYAAWLQKSITDDASDFITCVQSADLVITDHYAIDDKWQRLVINQLHCYLVAIDDLVRTHDADLIIDQTLGRHSSEYIGKGRALTGSDYALLAPNFLALREQAFQRTLSKEQPHVLISMGGVDNPNATLATLKVLIGELDTRFTVLLSPRAPHYQEVKEWCDKYDNVEHKSFESDMAHLMLKHDIAIGAPGTTSWERACLGLPSILIPLAENQTTICSQLLAHHAIIKVSLSNIESELLTAYKKLIARWTDYYQNNLKLCDGLGTRRVALEIYQLLEPNRYTHFQLIRATNDDAETVYQWQCHPKTRAFSLNTNIPTWEMHKQWMEKKLANSRDYFYIVADKNSTQKLGVLRLDNIKPRHYLVSIYVAPNSYGKGVATAALRMADELHPDVTLHATVLKDNLASQKLFQKANYTQINAETYIRYPI